MKIIVTGGAGFIGSNLIKKLLEDTSNTILNIDKLTYAANEDTLSYLQSSRHIHQRLDICDYQNVKVLIEDFAPDVIFHLAAESHVDRSITGPDAFVETNVFGTVNLLKVATEYWQKLDEESQQTFRFVHISTDEVYGDLEPDEAKFSEVTAYAPSSPYSASKAASDHMVMAWHRTYGLPVLLSNCSNNYGPFQFPEKLIPLAITRLLAEKSFGLYGDGLQIRDWLYVEDHVDALLTIWRKGGVGSSYNVGGDNEITNLALIKDLCCLLDEYHPRKGGDSYADLIVFIGDRPGHDRRYAIDNTKITQELGWKPAHTFEQALPHTIQWYLDNQNWCETALRQK